MVVDVEMRATVFLLQLLEEAAPDTVDPDAALDALETVAAWVNQLPTDERRAFAVRLQQYATKEPEPWLAKFARDLPNMLGMTSPGRRRRRWRHTNGQPALCLPGCSHEFTWSGRTDLLLLLHGADPDHENGNGISPRGVAETVANHDLEQFFS